LESVDEQREERSAEQLLPLVYTELRRLAAQKLAHEKPGQTLQATALVHEAYIRLMGADQHWHNSGHFFAAAAEAMRRILVESARRKQSAKHGGKRHRMELQECDLRIDPPADDILALNEALEALALQDPQMVELVKLRYFAGLTLQQAADILELPRRSADRHWAYARTWLYRQIRQGNERV
jgi:RNA polymerase sigma factor (TIGR02999 family)